MALRLSGALQSQVSAIRHVPLFLFWNLTGIHTVITITAARRPAENGVGE